MLLNEGCNSSLQSRNFNFQLRFALTGLANSEEDLIEEERIYANSTEYLDSTRVDRKAIQTSYSSTSMFDGTTSMGVGRYVEECRNATIGADLDLLTDTLNFLLFDCTEESTNYDSVQVNVKEQTPLLISDFTEYKYKNGWQKQRKDVSKNVNVYL